MLNQTRWLRVSVVLFSVFILPGFLGMESVSAMGWTPDGERVLFQSGRSGHPTASTSFFTVSVDGGLPEALPIPREWSLSRNQQHPFGIGDREVGAVE